MRSSTHNQTRVALVISAAVVGAGAAIGFAAGGIGDAVRGQLGQSVAFLAATVLLQLFALKVPGRGSIGVSAVGIVASGIVLGAGPAMAIAVLTAAVQFLRRRGLVHRALFDVANLTLSAGASAVVFDAVAGIDGAGLVQLAAALAGGVAFGAVNVSLLCLAMAASESASLVRIWRERFHWSRYHMLAWGPLALLAATAYAGLGAASLLAFVLPPILLTLSMQTSLERVLRTLPQTA